MTPRRHKPERQRREVRRASRRHALDGVVVDGGLVGARAAVDHTAGGDDVIALARRYVVAADGPVVAGATDDSHGSRLGELGRRVRRATVIGERVVARAEIDEYRDRVTHKRDAI